LKSLERRFVVGLAVTLLVVFGLLLWGAVAAVKSLSEAYVVARLEHDAESLLAVLQPGPRGQMRLREGRITPIYQQPLSGHYFQFDFADGRQIRSRSLWDEGLPAASLQAGGVTTMQVPGPGGQLLQLRTAGYAKADAGFTLTVAEDLTPLARDIRRFQEIALAVLLLALLVIVLVQRYVLRRGFRSLDEVREELHQIAVGGRQRLEVMGPVEIRPLTGEVNRLLNQLQERLSRSRQALGNLAHALKGPLSLATRELDRLPLQTDERQRLTGQLARIRGLIERELKRARFAGDGTQRRFVPREHVAELLDALRQLYRERGLQIRSGALPEGTLPFDHEDMLELLGNLLDNACKWASRQVLLEIWFDDGLTIRVADDGPGVADSEQAALLRRGSRLDEQEAGHGLGLAIVKDLVSDYHGQIGLARAADLGGLEVRVSLPVAVSAGATGAG
jgi:signal transduction histidine kinase